MSSNEPSSPILGRSTPIGFECELEYGADDENKFVIRHNPASDECVLYIAQNTKPRDYVRSPRGGGRCRTHERPAREPSCPFCPGNEALCAAPVAVLGEPWVARCFENRYPIFHALGTGRRTREHEIRAAGHMEVIVASRRHDVCLAQQTPDEVARLVLLWRDRFSALSPRARYVTQFINHGARAGGSLQHAHFQVVALQFVPPAVMRLVRAQSQAAPGCAICDAVKRARRERRVVFDADAVAFAETATHSGTVWITTACRRRIDDATDHELTAFAHALQAVAKLAYDAFDDPDFNVAIYSAPTNSTSNFHFYAVYVPHLVEDCSLARIQYGMAATSMLPEIAAKTLLRDAQLPN
ncbi:hypothetical protein CTAYLR_009340 [Chrysophaeum taylorii]|uniref:Galactose-1-phosphate uridyl transferase N-terminal domain-containing protein n=1 Tax=Chrysophaeum taylorii TaxID=2483200 RepID=A0AAD7U9X7_9STRA|nr:hypothetical protein CTAYLR_009340 [Chrysophaeum taylorii]